MSPSVNKGQALDGNDGQTSDGTPEVVDHSRDEKTKHEHPRAPDGGLRAWLVAAGASSVIFAALGFANSFGAFQEYYMTHQLSHKSANDIAWIGSVAAFAQFAVGTIAGPVFDRVGAWVIRPAAILCVFSVFMTSLCKEYWQFMLAQGILFGVSTGFMQFPAMTAVSQYFDKKRAAAMGLSVAGSSIGGVVFPTVLSKLLNSSNLGFGWSVRVLAFIMLGPLLFACIVIRSRLPPRETNFFIGAAWKKKDFLFLVAAMFFMLLGMFMPIFFMPSYAVSRGMDPTLASYLLAILNAASTFGRIVPGILADKFGRINIFGGGGICTGIVILCFNLPKSNTGLIVYSVVVGFMSGTIVSGGTTALTGCVGNSQEVGTYMGMGLGVSAIAVLIGPPIDGALEHSYHGYSQVAIFAGVVCLVGGFIALGAKIWKPQGLLGRV